MLTSHAEMKRGDFVIARKVVGSEALEAVEPGTVRYPRRLVEARRKMMHRAIGKFQKEEVGAALKKILSGGDAPTDFNALESYELSPEQRAKLSPHFWGAAPFQPYNRMGLGNLRRLAQDGGQRAGPAPGGRRADGPHQAQAGRAVPRPPQGAGHLPDRAEQHPKISMPPEAQVAELHALLTRMELGTQLLGLRHEESQAEREALAGEIAREWRELRSAGSQEQISDLLDTLWETTSEDY